MTTRSITNRGGIDELALYSFSLTEDTLEADPGGCPGGYPTQLRTGTPNQEDHAQTSAQTPEGPAGSGWGMGDGEWGRLDSK